MIRQLGIAALVLSSLALNTGCIPFGCGAGPVASPNSGNREVHFDDTQVGSSETLQVPFADSVSTMAETIESATISGPDAAAFAVTATFPIAIAAGAQVMLQLSFTPTHSGTSTAQLTLNTAEMGPSPVTLEGTGVAP